MDMNYKDPKVIAAAVVVLVVVVVVVMWAAKIGPFA